MKKVAEIISLLLNPAFLALALILIGIEKSELADSYVYILTLTALVLNGLIPFYLVTYFFQKKGIILDDILENKEVLKNRPSVLAWGTLIFLFETILVYFLKMPQPLFAVLSVLFLSTLILFLITLYKKISLHATGATNFVLIILFLFGYSFWPVLFLIPIIFWSRFILLRHTIKQMVAGFLVASLAVFLVFYYFELLPHIPIS